VGTRHLTDAMIRDLRPPAKGNRIVYDDTVTGLGIRATAAGHKAFVLGYTVRGSGKQRRYTIGDFGDWSTRAARNRARELKAAIDQGGDPLADIEAERGAPTVGDLIKRFQEEHLAILRPGTRADYVRMIRSHVLPHLGEKKKAADIVFDDIAALHRKITKAGHPYRANRTVTLLSKAFSLAVHWGWREGNPCKGVKRNAEHHRERYLSGGELARLTEALAKVDPDIGDVIRLLLLTGARRGEVLSMKWNDLDLTAGTWSKPPTSTKQNKRHTVPLSAPARQILAERLSKKGDGETYVFPGVGRRGHTVNVWRQWQRILRAAKIEGLRLHDLRHQFASELVSSGASLPLIGSLLGHRNVQTTSRYAHLYRDVQIAAVERVGDAVMNAGKPAVEPTPLKRDRP
jgi:integrase